MIKDAQYIIKRIIIGVGIALILLLLKKNSFILPVHARTTINGGVIFQTPSDNPINNYDNTYFTNIDYDSSLDYKDYTALTYDFKATGSGGIVTSCSKHSIGDISDSFSLTTNCTSYDGATITNFNIALGGALGFNHLEYDKPYSIALQFSKSDNLSWVGIYRNGASYLKFNVYDHDSETLLEDVSFMRDVNYSFYYMFDNSMETNIGYLIISFTPSSVDFVDSSHSISLANIKYDSCGDLCNTSGESFARTILSNSTSNNYKFSNKSLFFIQGSIQPYGEWCNSDGGHQGCGITGDNPFGDIEGMDTIHDNDLDIINESPQCDNLDIPCHLRRLYKIISDFFIRFGNYFRDFTKELKQSLVDLFVPSSDYFESFFNTLSTNVENQLGFLSYPIVLLSNIFNRFYSLERSSHITYSGFEYPPNSNNLLIPAFDLDLDSLVASGSLYTLYNIYFVFINGLFCVLFIRLCVKKFNQIFGGGAL